MSINKFKIGDEVKVKHLGTIQDFRSLVQNRFPYLAFNYDMLKLRGKSFQILGKCSGGYSDCFQISHDGCTWAPEWLEPVEKTPRKIKISELV